MIILTQKLCILIEFLYNRNMTNFFYRAKNKNNEIITGHIGAPNISDAALKLEKKGLIILELSVNISTEEKFTEINNITGNTIFSIKEKREFINAFYFQYKSGLSLQQIFGLIAQSTSSKNIQTLCLAILKQTEKGKSLKEAFSKYENTIGKAYTALICAGETSGKLDEILLSVSENLQREEEIKNSIISSLIYPICLLCLALAVFILFKTCIFKVFETMFSGICAEEITKLLIFAVFNIIITFSAIGFFIFFILKNKKAKYTFSRFLTSLPFLSGLIKDYYFQNFFNVLSLAFHAGIPAAEAVELANGTIKEKIINNKIKKSIKMINSGCEITTAFMVAGVFSKDAISQISTGEKTGELDTTAKTAAENYAKSLEMKIKTVTKLIEPAMLILIGILVAYIAVTAYSKYYESLFSIF